MPDVVTMIHIGDFTIQAFDVRPLTETERKQVQQMHLDMTGRESFPESGCCVMFTGFEASG